MFRLYQFEEPYSVRLRIEGALTAELVPSLEQAWGEVVSKGQDRKLSVDASSITLADEAAIAFLNRLQALGAKVDDDGRFVGRNKHDGALRGIRRALCSALCAVIPGLHGCPCEQRA